MNKNGSFLQKLLLNIHYKTALGMVTVLLGLLTFSGVYFFGQNIVNEADEKQKIAKIQLKEAQEEERLGTNTSEVADLSITPTVAQNSGNNIGGDTVSVTPTVRDTVSPTSSPSATPTATTSATPTPTVSLPQGALMLGKIDARVTITTYTDFECEYCAGFVKDTLPKLQQNYVDTGKAVIVFKNYPLVAHKTAPYAHNAAMCAAEQGKFWEFHSQLFSNRKDWIGKSEPDANVYFSQYAQALKLDPMDFASCLTNHTYQEQIDADKAEGKAKGISGTPSFFVNSTPIVGAQPYESFKTIIDAELSESK